MLIDDFSGEELFSPVGSKRRGVRDRVMGSISIAGVTSDVLDGQTCLRLAGDIRTENTSMRQISLASVRRYAAKGNCTQCIFTPRTMDVLGNPIDPNLGHSRSGKRSPYLSPPLSRIAWNHL